MGGGRKRKIAAWLLILLLARPAYSFNFRCLWPFKIFGWSLKATDQEKAAAIKAFKHDKLLFSSDMLTADELLDRAATILQMQGERFQPVVVGRDEHGNDINGLQILAPRDGDDHHPLNTFVGVLAEGMGGVDVVYSPAMVGISTARYDGSQPRRIFLSHDAIELSQPDHRTHHEALHAYLDYILTHLRQVGLFHGNIGEPGLLTALQGPRIFPYTRRFTLEEIPAFALTLRLLSIEGRSLVNGPRLILVVPHMRWDVVQLQLVALRSTNSSSVARENLEHGDRFFLQAKEDANGQPILWASIDSGGGRKIQLPMTNPAFVKAYSALTQTGKNGDGFTLAARMGVEREMRRELIDRLTRLHRVAEDVAHRADALSRMLDKPLNAFTAADFDALMEDTRQLRLATLPYFSSVGN
jgi:hypothetical protein